MTNTTLVSDIVKEYPHMLRIYIYHNSYPLNSNPGTSKRKLTPEQRSEMSIHRSVRRTKSSITDIIICNKFDMWATFTFDPQKVDRYDAQMCKMKMSKWLRNQKRNSPDLMYLIVPEFHKKCEECAMNHVDECSHKNRKKALHFHALMKNFNGQHTKTKVIQNGRDVYKFSGYRWGRSHFVKINASEGDYARVGTYMQKYITKDMPVFESKKRYWCSENLNRPKTYVNGVSRFGLQRVIRKHPPKYQTEMIEVQEHYGMATSLMDVTLSPQLPTLDLKSSSILAIPTPKNRRTKRQENLLNSWSH